MDRVEKIFESACQNLDIPGAILIAGNVSGTFNYAKAFGVRTLKDPSKPEPMQLDTVMWIASCTKLMTTVAAMQCVERGLLSLDSDITDVLPEFKGIQILKGFDESTGKPILVDSKKTITLRHLLTHSSGIGYDIFNPLLSRYTKWAKGVAPVLGTTAEKSIKETAKIPLLFEPGESWEYSVGIDWAGQMVERVNDNINLEEYLKKNVWGPLGMKNVTFFPSQHPEVLSRLATVSWRHGGTNIFGSTDNPDGKVEYTNELFYTLKAKECEGGAGGYASPSEYFKLLMSICANDGKILKSETIEEMFKPQLSEQSKNAFSDLLALPEVNNTLGGFPGGADYGLSGIMNMDDLSCRKAGTLAWGGYPNLKWWIDRKAGVCGILGTQICPPGDPKVIELFWLWEREVYRNTIRQEKL